MKLADLAPLIERNKAIDVRICLLDGSDPLRWFVAIHPWDEDADDWEIDSIADGQSTDLGVAIHDAVQLALRNPA